MVESLRKRQNTEQQEDGTAGMKNSTKGIELKWF